jgi:hypothetical protein
MVRTVRGHVAFNATAAIAGGYAQIREAIKALKRQ